MQQKILIVDDKKQNLLALEKLLRATGAAVARATSGNEALEASLNHDFALAILDVEMPGMDGYELAELLRMEERTRRVPVILMSAAYSEAQHVFKGYDAGAVDYIVKPFDAGEYDSWVEAPDGKTGRRYAERRDGPIHLLIADVIMPQMSGRDLAERLTASRPETKVLFMSGYTDDIIAHHGVLEPGVTLIQKPFAAGVLGTKVRELLDAPDQARGPGT